MNSNLLFFDGMFDETDPEKEKIESLLVQLNSSCNNLDDNGNYGNPSNQAEEECKDLICFIDENVMCQNKLCMIVNEDKIYIPILGIKIGLTQIKIVIKFGDEMRLNPIEIKRKRFDDELIEIMEKLQWWNKSIEEINNLIPLLTNSNLEYVKKELRKML